MKADGLIMESFEYWTMEITGNSIWRNVSSFFVPWLLRCEAVQKNQMLASRLDRMPAECGHCFFFFSSLLGGSILHTEAYFARGSRNE